MQPRGHSVQEQCLDVKIEEFQSLYCFIDTINILILVVSIVLQKNIPVGIVHWLNPSLLGKVTTWRLNRNVNNYTVHGHVSDFGLSGNISHSSGFLYFPLVSGSQNTSVVVRN